MKKEELKNRGITLIALIITIIVMLILVAVTVNVALNGGLIGKAQEAKAKTEKAQIQERDILTGRVKIGDTWYNSLDKYLAGEKSEDQSDGTTYEIIDVELQKGDYVNYHYKDDSGADAFISCMFVGPRVGSEMTGTTAEYFDDTSALFPLSSLERLTIYPQSGTVDIKTAEDKWTNTLGAKVSNLRTKCRECVATIKRSWYCKIL